MLVNLVKSVTSSNKKTNKISGICKSIQHSNMYWSYENSGKYEMLCTLNDKGEKIKEFELNIKTINVEDCSSGIINGIPTIIIGDFGDNTLQRKIYTIYVFTEPTDLNLSVKLNPKIIKFSFPDNKSRNTKACSLLKDGTINIISKSRSFDSGTTVKYNIKSWLSGHENIKVVKITNFSSQYGLITAMDSNDDIDIFLSNGFIHVLGDRAYKKIKLTKTAKSEGICWSHNGKYVIIIHEQHKQISTIRIF